ncbi:hypothetical protein GCM10022219_27150 [Microbacterium oryzae]|uniref:TadE-like domain-containing protein n=1 Tax=Microbacterium oryzae TaxID=743009 RepID=A0A6I6E3A2_9MICO|nr:TadE family type IV pilus minor pilin [Microbacterium oryzae]QGU28664.1 hypothetical protein D7D94_14050 [Microbacterium oryzae]
MPRAVRRRLPLLDDRGAVAAELAVALPAVLLVVALGIAGLGASARQVQLQDAAADAARLLARGEGHGRAAGVAAAVDGALSVAHEGDLVCATVAATVRLGGAALPLSASSCALAGGV